MLKLSKQKLQDFNIRFYGDTVTVKFTEEQVELVFVAKFSQQPNRAIRQIQ